MDPLILSLIAAGISYGLQAMKEHGEPPTPEQVREHLLVALDGALAASQELAGAARQAAGEPPEIRAPRQPETEER